MSSLPHHLPPSPLSYYADHNRFDWYFRRDETSQRPCTSQRPTQSWDLFGAWGQEQLLMKSKAGLCEVESNRLLMNYTAPYPTVPTFTDQKLEGGVEDDPCTLPSKEYMELVRIKEAIMYRISMVKDKRKKYGTEVKHVSLVAKNLLRQIRKRLQLSPLLPSSEDVDESLDSSLLDTTGSDGTFQNKRQSIDDSMAEKEMFADADIEKLRETVEGITEQSSLVNRVLCGMHRDKKLFADIRIPYLPTDYIGGCLSSTRSHSGDTYLAYSTGASLSGLTVAQVSQGDHFTELSAVCTSKNSQPIRQVQLMAYGDEMMTVIRVDKHLSLYKVSDDSLYLSGEANSTVEADVGHMCMNPYYPEVVYVSNKSILRWGMYSTPTQLLSHWEPRFSVGTDIRSMHYGCNPQHLVLTDPTVCSVFDTRSRSCGVDLFEVPSNKLLHMEERLITSVQAKDFTHYILAQHTLLGVDERFPKYPVIYQLLPALAWPMLINQTTINSQTDLLLVGCPTNQEVFSMIAKNSESGFKTTPIWKCSQPSDISYFRDTVPSTSERIAIKQRLQAGLLGLTATQQDDSENFTVHMLTGKGDLFQQTYINESAEGSGLPADSLRDVAHSAGPRLSEADTVDVPACVTDRCRTWYSSCKVAEPSMGSDISPPPILIEKSSLLQAYQLCAMCNGDQSRSIQLASEVDNLQCLVCGLTVEQTKSLLSSHRAKTYCKIGEEEVPNPTQLDDFDPAESAGTDANSKLLLQLWKGGDIEAVLTDRDREWDSRRERMQRKAAGEGSVNFGAFDGLSSLSSVSGRSLSRRSVYSSASRFSLSKQKKRPPSVISSPGFRSPKHDPRRSQGALSDEEENIMSSTLPARMWETPPPTLFTPTALTARKNKSKKKGAKGF